MRPCTWSGRVPGVRLALRESDDNQGDDDDSSGFCGPRTLLLYPRHSQPLTVSHGCGEGRVLQHLQGREGPALHSSSSDPTLSGQDSRSGHTGAKKIGKRTTLVGSRSMTWVWACCFSTRFPVEGRQEGPAGDHRPRVGWNFPGQSRERLWRRQHVESVESYI